MKTSISNFYRIIDANFNRAREGIRVVEEIARFVLEDTVLAGRLRRVRHRLHALQQTFPGSPECLIEARDSAGDVGLDYKEEKEDQRLSYRDLLAANFKRVQESLRVLEEYAKFIGSGREFKKVRFEVYELEKEMSVCLVPEDLPGLRRQVDYSLYVIVGEKFTQGKSLVEVAGLAIDGGATVMQLREKDYPTRRLIEVGLELRCLTRKKGVTFLINDRVDVALAVQADGVHLGQDDLPLKAARQILGPGKIIGISTHNLEEALAAQQQGADYIGVGPVGETKTKDTGHAPVGLGLFRQMKGKIIIPKVAIGGISARNATEVIMAGADGVAVITAVAGAPDIKEAASVLRAQINEAKK